MTFPSDPTYVKSDIDANPHWKLAFWLSEVDNDNAPIGWFRYVIIARFLMAKFDLDLSILEDSNVWKNKL